MALGRIDDRTVSPRGRRRRSELGSSRHLPRLVVPLRRGLEEDGSHPPDERGLGPGHLPSPRAHPRQQVPRGGRPRATSLIVPVSVPFQTCGAQKSPAEAGVVRRMRGARPTRRRSQAAALTSSARRAVERRPEHSGSAWAPSWTPGRQSGARRAHPSAARPAIAPTGRRGGGREPARGQRGRQRALSRAYGGPSPACERRRPASGRRRRRAASQACGQRRLHPGGRACELWRRTAASRARGQRRLHPGGRACELWRRTAASRACGRWRRTAASRACGRRRREPEGRPCEL